MCFPHYLSHWLLSVVFNTRAAYSLCFIRRVVCSAWSGIPQSPLICCQIFINVTELRSTNDASIFHSGRGYNELVGLLKPFGVSVTLKKNTTYPLMFYKINRALFNYCYLEQMYHLLWSLNMNLPNLNILFICHLSMGTNVFKKK